MGEKKILVVPAAWTDGSSPVNMAWKYGLPAARTTLWAPISTSSATMVTSHNKLWLWIWRYNVDPLVLFETFKNTQQGATSPAQLVHDFESLPHVTRVESDGTRPLHSVFFLQRMWTKSSAPEGDGSQRQKLRTTSLVRPQHVGGGRKMPQQQISECFIFLLYISLLETRSLYKRRNKQHAPELQMNSPADLHPVTCTATTLTLSLSGGTCASDCVSAAVRFHRLPFWTFCLSLRQTGRRQQVESSRWLQSDLLMWSRLPCCYLLNKTPI